MKSERITPKLTVDIVFFDKEGNIILVERKNEPLGKALPG
jgi:ADP-ribose pyrophosphatase YjhB (NUDIX family)